MISKPFHTSTHAFALVLIAVSLSSLLYKDPR
jgi:hypothetical protein